MKHKLGLLALLTHLSMPMWIILLSVHSHLMLPELCLLVLTKSLSSWIRDHIFTEREHFV